MDASNLLKPALASGTIRCIGSTTYKEYRNYFEKDRALVRRFQKIDVNEPTIEDSIKILQRPQALLRAAPQGPLHRRRDQGRGRAVASLHRRPQAARQGDRRDRRDRRGADAGAGKQAAQDDHREGGRGLHRDDGAHPAEERVARRPRGAEEPRPRPEDGRVRPGRRDRGAGLGDQAGPRRPARAGEADRLLSVLRPDRRRQDRGRAPAGAHAGHRDHPLRHVRIHGAAHRVAADRRAAGLCRLRPGRAADRRDRPASA